MKRLVILYRWKEPTEVGAIEIRERQILWLGLDWQGTLSEGSSQVCVDDDRSTHITFPERRPSMVSRKYANVFPVGAVIAGGTSATPAGETIRIVGARVVYRPSRSKIAPRF